MIFFFGVVCLLFSSEEGALLKAFKILLLTDFSAHLVLILCKRRPHPQTSPRDCKKKEKIYQTILRVPRCLWGFFACGFQCLRGFPAVLLCPKPPGITLGFAAFPSARGHCWSADPSGPGGAGLSQPHGHSDFQFFSHIPVLLLF